MTPTKGLFSQEDDLFVENELNVAGESGGTATLVLPSLHAVKTSTVCGENERSKHL